MAGVVVDTSAWIAIVNAEPETEEFLKVLVAAEAIFMSAATAHEVNCVLQRYRQEDGPHLLNGLYERLEPQVIAFDQLQLEIARTAYMTYGRGSGHVAGLNMADCFSYALAKALDLPMLYKGNDFPHTDTKSATSQT